MGEWEVKRGESVVPFLGEEGLTGRQKRAREVVAVAGQASGGRRQPSG
jgi:hypothetical protein